MNQFARQKWRHRCREQTCGHQGEKAGQGVGAVGSGGGMNWVIRIDMYTLMCIKLMTNNLLYKKTRKIPIYQVYRRVQFKKKKHTTVTLKKNFFKVHKSNAAAKCKKIETKIKHRNKNEAFKNGKIHYIA